MGGTGFDRQPFKIRQNREKRAPSPVSGLLLLALVIALVIFGGYYYLQINGVPTFGAGTPDLTEITDRLEKIEERLTDLEERPGHPARAAATSTASAKKEAASVRSPSSSPSSPVSSAQASSQPAQRKESAPSSSKRGDERITQLQEGYSSLQSEVAANREAWDAASDRLVGNSAVLEEQSSEIGTNRKRLDTIQKHFDRTPVPFKMKKGSEKERVGPVWLWLRGTDHKRHRYTMRVFVDDKWIELKDRALLEPVEFYVSDVAIPLQLVVTEIRGNRVAGTLAVPEGLYAR